MKIIQKEVKFLTVVWGEKYIDRFCSLSLPSFLAPGNIPALVESTQLEVVIMTRESDINFFKRSPSFKALELLCPVRFVNIDDLITDGLYGVTLTLAYARPIIACGEDMLNTHFVFMNADFVLADGSLRSLSKHIHDERSIVLGPSYRAIAENLEPDLESMVDSSGILKASPRTLVGMALKHPHRTTIAKTYGHNAISSSHPNQLFWMVDNNTVLGHYFLSFMLCLKPERVIGQINCYCDYALIPELCPSGDEVMMGDSDEFFMLELQGRTQETEMLQLGPLQPREIANSLMEWATPEHLRASAHEVVFHADDIPSSIEEVRLEAGKVVNEIKSYIGSSQTHRNHHYWVTGVSCWMDARKSHGLTNSPIELAPTSFNIRTYLYLLLHKTVARLKEMVPTHPYHWIEELREKMFKKIRETSSDQRILIVGEPPMSHRYCVGEAKFDVETVAEFLKRESGQPRQYDQIIYLPSGDYSEENIIFDVMIAKLKKEGTMHIFSSCSEGVITSQSMSVVFANFLESVELYSNSFELETVGDLPGFFAHRPRLVARCFSNPLFRILMAPLLVVLSVLKRLLRPIGGPKKLTHPVALWFRVKLS